MISVNSPDSPAPTVTNLTRSGETQNASRFSAAQATRFPARRLPSINRQSATGHASTKAASAPCWNSLSTWSPSILLLHGNPVAARKTFENLIPALTQTGRVIAPDLPGFGSSTQKIPDYSIEAHAKHVLKFLHHIGISEVHVVAYSMGGGVALNLAHMSPELVRSITLLSAIGVQEFELLGNYHLNHALHGIQLAFIWLLKNGLPHMGLLDRVPVGLPYARNFYDTDQRPLDVSYRI